jgi:glutathione S-transferase
MAQDRIMTAADPRPIDVYTFGPAWGIPVFTASPFGVKLITWLRMHELAYELHIQNNPGKGPKGKAPWVVIDGETFADSQLIIEALSARRGIEEPGLSTRQRSIATVTRLMIEEHFHQVWEHELFVHDCGWKRSYEFFDQLPPGLRVVIRTVARSALRKQLIARGVGRHTHDQIIHLGKVALDTLDEMVGDGPFFFGDTPTEIDATLFGFMSLVHWTPSESPVWAHFRERTRLGAYCQRMLDRYYTKS